MTAPPAAAAATSWLRTTERGSALGLRLLIAICGLMGRGFTRLLLAPIVFYPRAASTWAAIDLATRALDPDELADADEHRS